MNTVAYFEIQVSEPERAIRFYESVFDWRFVKQDGFPIAYWRIETSGIDGGMLQRPARAPAVGCGTNASVCSIKTTDFAAAAALIEHSGGAVALPKFAIPGVCWQGYFLDTEGNTFGLFQPDDAAS